MMKAYAKENTLMLRAIRQMPQETYNAIVAARLSSRQERDIE
jgi:hypothetical protein